MKEENFTTPVEKVPINDNFGQRITEIRQYFCEGKNTIFASKIGKDTTFASQLCSGSKLPGKGVLEEILDAFPEVSRPWLYFGEGEMLRSQNIKKFLSVSEPQVDYTKTIPLIPYDAAAGLPSQMDNFGINFAECEQYSVPAFKQMGVDYLIRVSGDSMLPTYVSGDIIACTIIKDILFFQWGKVYVIDSSQGVLVKHVMRSEKGDDFITLVSDNKEKYPPFDIPRSDIRSLALVVGLIRAE